MPATIAKYVSDIKSLNVNCNYGWYPDTESLPEFTTKPTTLVEIRRNIMKMNPKWKLSTEGRIESMHNKHANTENINKMNPKEVIPKEHRNQNGNHKQSISARNPSINKMNPKEVIPKEHRKIDNTHKRSISAMGTSIHKMNPKEIIPREPRNKTENILVKSTWDKTEKSSIDELNSRRKDPIMEIIRKQVNNIECQLATDTNKTKNKTENNIVNKSVNELDAETSVHLEKPVSDANYADEQDDQELEDHCIPLVNLPVTPCADMDFAEFTELFNFEEDFLSQQEIKKVKDLLYKYKHVFANSDAELPGTDKFQMEIPTFAEPVSRKPYKIADKHKEFVSEQVKKLEKIGKIRPSISAYGAPTLVVPKKDGTFRWCMDFRDLNKVTKNITYPLPNISEMFTKLQGSRYFTTLDMRSAYWQMPVITEDRHKTAFVTFLGKKEFCNATPYGLKGAPDFFQFGMHKVIGEHYMTICVGLLDDIEILGKTFDEHLHNVELILIKLDLATLKLKPTKCQLFRSEVEFMGHIVNKDGIRPSERKINSIKKLVPPTDKKELQSFLGIVNQYRQWIPNFGDLAKDMYNITGPKSKFIWTDGMTDQFEQLKSCIIKRPILKYPDPSKDFIIYTDASGTAMGAAILQEHEGTLHPVCFVSKHFTDAQLNWSTTEKEYYAVYYTLSSQDQILNGNKVILYTDHRPVVDIFRSYKTLTGKFYRWMQCCARFDILVKYIPGRENILADTLSRKVKRTIYELTDDEESIRLTQSKDALCQIVKRFLETEIYPNIKDKFLTAVFNKHANNWFIEDDIVKLTLTNMNGLIRTLIVLDQETAKRMMKWIHQSIFGGHFSTHRTLEAFRECYFAIQDYTIAKYTVEQCIHCQVSKNPRTKRPKLEPFPVYTRPLELFGMDFFGPLTPKSTEGYSYLLVLVDYCTKWPIVIPTRTRRAEEIAAAILHQVVPIYGLPKAIISDNAKEFVSKALALLYQKLGIKKIDIAPYSPQLNGQVESMMKPLQNTLRTYCQDSIDWSGMIPHFLTAYRNTVHSSTLLSPFYALFGTDMRTPYRFLLDKDNHFVEHGKSQQGFINDQLQQLKKAHAFVSHNNAEAKVKQKKYYDKKAREKVYEVGMTCVLKNRQPSMDGRSKKLRPLFHRPSRITKVFATQLEVENLIGRKNKPHMESKINVKILPEVELLEYIHRELNEPLLEKYYYADDEELADIKAAKAEDVKATEAENLKAAKAENVKVTQAEEINATKAENLKAAKTKDAKATKVETTKAKKAKDTKAKKAKDTKAKKANENAKAKDTPANKAENTEAVNAHQMKTRSKK